MAAVDDFFGLNTLGADPYHALVSNRLSRLQQLDSLFQAQAGAPAGGQLQGGGGPEAGPSMMPGSRPGPSAPMQNFMGGVPGGGFGGILSMLARNAMTKGTSSGGLDPRQMEQFRGELSANITGDSPDPGGGGGGGTPGGDGNCPPGYSYWGPQFGCRKDSDPSPCPPGTHFDSGQCVDNGTTPPGGPPPGNPPPGGDPRPTPSPNPPPREAGGSPGAGPYTDATIPRDLQALRGMLGVWLSQNFNQYNPQYTGQLTVGQSGYIPDAATAGLNSFTDARNTLGMAGNPLSDLLGFNATSNLSGLNDPLAKILSGANSAFDPTGIQQLINQGGFNTAASRNYFDAGASASERGLNQATPFFNQAGSMLNNLQSLTANGGAPDIQGALDAIRSKGLMDIEDQNAQTREQFGAMGLGASSDVAEAVARGSSRGIAQITADQSQLATQILSAAKDRQLSSVIQGVGAGTGIGSAFGSLGLGIGQNYLGAGQGVLGQAGSLNNLGQLLLGTNTANSGFQNAGLDRILQGLPVGQNILNNPANLALASAGVRGNALGQIPGIAGAQSAAGTNYGQLLAALAGMDQQRQGNNLNMLYQDFIRSTTNPYLNTAAGYATGFPPTPNPVNTGFQGWGALGSIGGGLLGLLAASDRNLKADIREIEEPKPITKRLKRLPISTWRYKWDDTRHIGPMAQDWQETFGIGDGKTIYIPDILNVVLGVLKETAHA